MHRPTKINPQKSFKCLAPWQGSAQLSECQLCLCGSSLCPLSLSQASSSHPAQNSSLTQHPSVVIYEIVVKLQFVPGSIYGSCDNQNDVHSAQPKVCQPILDPSLTFICLGLHSLINRLKENLQFWRFAKAICGKPRKAVRKTGKGAGRPGRGNALQNTSAFVREGKVEG